MFLKLAGVYRLLNFSLQRAVRFAVVAFSMLFFVSLANDCSWASDPKEIHWVDSASWQADSVSPSSMNQRVQESAKELRQHAPVPRLVLSDIAFPKDAKEFEDMDGYSILLLVVLTQDSAEIPPARVFARIKGKDITLIRFSSVSSKSPKGSLVEKVLGPNRWEGLFLLPTYLMIESEALLVDFSAHRKDFIFSSPSEDGPLKLDYLSIIRKPMRNAPQNNALKELIGREYPGFIQK